jgi:hypothetical protein
LDRPEERGFVMAATSFHQNCMADCHTIKSRLHGRDSFTHLHPLRTSSEMLHLMAGMCR